MCGRIVPPGIVAGLSACRRWRRGHVDRHVSVLSSSRKEKRKNKKRELFDASLFAFSFFFGFCALVEAFCLAVNGFLLLLFFCALLLCSSSRSLLFSSSSLSSVVSFRLGFFSSVNRFDLLVFPLAFSPIPTSGPIRTQEPNQPKPEGPSIFILHFKICQSTQFPRKDLIDSLWISPGPFERAMAEVSNTRLYLGNLPRNGMLPAFHRHHHCPPRLLP